MAWTSLRRRDRVSQPTRELRRTRHEYGNWRVGARAPRPRADAAHCATPPASVADHDDPRETNPPPGHRDTSPGGSYGTPGAGAAAKGARMQAECPQGFRLRDTAGSASEKEMTTCSTV